MYCPIYLIKLNCYIYQAAFEPGWQALNSDILACQLRQELSFDIRVEGVDFLLNVEGEFQGCDNAAISADVVQVQMQIPLRVFSKRLQGWEGQFMRQTAWT